MLPNSDPGAEAVEPSTPEIEPKASSSAPQLELPVSPAPHSVKSNRPRFAISPRGKKRLVWALTWLIIAVILWFTVISSFIAYRRSHALTDDAFVESHLVHLSSQTPGLIVRAFVEERDVVHAGQLLAEVDPESFRRQLELAIAKRRGVESQLVLEQSTLHRLQQELPRKVAASRAELALADSSLNQAREQLQVVTADIENAVLEGEAAVDSAKAALIKAADDANRYKNLYETESIPKTRWEEAVKIHATAEAEMKAAEAKLDRTKVNRRKIVIAEQEVTIAMRRSEHAREDLKLTELGELQIEEQKLKVDVLIREVEQAKRNEDTVSTQLEYCKIVSPCDGIIVKRYRNPGDHVAVGAPILSIYDPELIYVTAYLEENRLYGISPGNSVDMYVDAFGETIKGRVVWIGQATGANFALVPRDISSGEFTKVPQRVPIRIAPDRDSHWSELRPGLSVSVAIARGPGDFEWARREADRLRARGERGVSPLNRQGDTKPQSPVEQQP